MYFALSYWQVKWFCRKSLIPFFIPNHHYILRIKWFIFKALGCKKLLKVQAFMVLSSDIRNIKTATHFDQPIITHFSLFHFTILFYSTLTCQITRGVIVNSTTIILAFLILDYYTISTLKFTSNSKKNSCGENLPMTSMSFINLKTDESPSSKKVLNPKFYTFTTIGG